ncbi:MAG: CHAT domain-containing protein [Catenulispora sp.]|nr:CHAT domain-containing protein [Catenulispora sp.]
MTVGESHLAAARALVARVTASEDLALMLQPEATRLIGRLTDLLDEPETGDETEVELRAVLGQLLWMRSGAGTGGRANRDSARAVELFFTVFAAPVDFTDAIPDELVPILAGLIVPAAIEMLSDAAASQDPDVHDATVFLWHRIATTTAGDDEDLAIRLSYLGGALLGRFRLTGEEADLDAAADAGKRAVSFAPPGHPDRSVCLANLSATLRLRFEMAGRPADLDAAIAAAREAATATAPGDPERGAILSNLGAALRIRFDLSGQPSDLSAAIVVGTEAVEITSLDDPHRPTRLSHLGTALQRRFEQYGVLEDLDAAIVHLRACAAAIPAGDVERPISLANLASALHARFQRLGTLDDLDFAITAGLEAVSTSHPSDPHLTLSLSNLGLAQLARFERQGRPQDLDAATANLRDAAAHTPTGHPHRATYLSGFGNALVARYERFGALDVLDAAISTLHDAVLAAPADHPDRAMYLSNWGQALRARFGRSGALEDVDAAVAASRRAVAAVPPGHSGRAIHLSNLGLTLFDRFARVEDSADLDAAIDSLLAAVDATPADDPARSLILGNLGTALLSRFERSASLTDLTMATGVLHAAVALTPADHPDNANNLSALGSALFARAAFFGSMEDLDAAIAAGRAAAAAAPADHPDRATRLTNLSTALRKRFELSGNDADAREAVAWCTQAAETESASPSNRVIALLYTAIICDTSDPRTAARCLETAVGLLPRLAARHLHRGDQQFALRHADGIASMAAALALSDDSVPEQLRPVRALRLLEAGRAVLMSQALDTRSDLKDLSHHHSGLAQRYCELRDLLDQDAPVQTASADLMGAVRLDRRRLAEEFDRILDDIHGLPGFSSFAQLPDSDELLAQAHGGPIVSVSVSTYRSDALLLTAGGVIAVPLPDLGIQVVHDQIETFQQALEDCHTGQSFAARKAGQKSLLSVLAWLWDAFAEPVLTALGYHTPPTDGRWPRVWWAPGGLLSLLPIHAAGHHEAPDASRTVIDRVVSSYTPTIRALRYSRQQAAIASAADNTDGSGSLVVAMPDTPDLPTPRPLPGAAQEAAIVATHLANTAILMGSEHRGPDIDHRRPADTPTRTAVFERLPTTAVVHFACHGTHDPADPSASRLLLQDHATAPLTVASLARVRLDHAQLAYLSACRTAFQGTVLLDEAIHLGSAFQLAGFPHVIATLWEIVDRVSVTVADSFYSRLSSRSGDDMLDTSRAAEALHHTVRETRDKYPKLPFLWAAYLHSGV